MEPVETSHCIFRNEKPAITSAPREVESIDTIIDQIKQKCSSNQALIQKVEKAISSDSESGNQPDENKIDQPDQKNLDPARTVMNRPAGTCHPETTRSRD